jgi:hypothetical protein
VTLPSIPSLHLLQTEPILRPLVYVVLGNLSSIVHQIGLVVLIQILSLANQFEVDMSPSKLDSWSAANSIRIDRMKSETRCLLQFHSSPFIESLVDSTPTGRRPHVGPKKLLSRLISCSPWEVYGKEIVTIEKGRPYRVQDPSNVIISHDEYLFSDLAQFM